MSIQIMLRAKHFGTLSQSARFFFLSGSRCNAADGSSCTCTEDETCISRKQQTRNEVRPARMAPVIVPKTSARVGSLMSGDTVKAVNSHKAENSNVRWEWNVHQLTQNYVVDRTRPLSNIKSSNVKTFRKDKVPGKSFVEAEAGPIPTVNSHGAKGTVEKSGLVNDFDTVSNNGARNSVDTYEVSSDSLGLNKLPRETKIPTGVSPLTRQFASNGRVVETVFHILRQLKWGPATQEALGKLNCSMDAYQGNQVLKQLQDHSVALSLFYWLKRQAGFKHDGHTYTTMIGILGRARQFSAINKLLDQMIRDGCQPNVVTSGYLDFAMYMYQRMQDAGLSPNTFTYSVIINCLGKAGHLTAAHKLFSEMVSQGCEPNLVTYNIMIALHAKVRSYSNALDLYHKMQNAGFDPDNVTYSIVMEVLGHCGYLEEAEAVYAEMKRKNWVPDAPVYGLLVDLWGKAGNVEKAWGWYQAMLDAGLCPNVPTLTLCCSVAALRLKHFFDMGFCCELMAVTCHPAHTFLQSMPACGPDGQNVRDHMSNFLDMMHSEDRESKRGLVDAMVDFLHKSGLKEEAGSVWEVTAEKNVYPDALKQKSPVLLSH
ncbi:pentatricopeptide repeat (PPR) superfamily protein [Actinidia rufa]|uniref:Pentatricopeptide repeat (PPR) superfamily protein n=1 Tax=Actinidia rufa TaxID=165716 RepID=A0A7J0GMM8_9ERIC|nr:pentatricopeptide repeat (PPR) superfamily protein [Actinidia rufa]